jgi:alkaline phosphatase
MPSVDFHQSSNKRTAVLTAAVAVVAVTSMGLGGQTKTPASTTRGAARATTQADQLKEAINDGRAKNVILFLGDGMGDSEITVARNYEVGANGRLTMDSLPLTGAYTTYSVDEKDPSQIDYVTDSAASGTGWATGVKTSNGRISTPAGSTETTGLVTILELAQRAGLRTGNVTTAELTDATPAVLASHVNNRGCMGPADMAPCNLFKKEFDGPGSIAEQEVDHHVDVLLGGGKLRFQQTITGGPHAGKTVIESAQAQGYDIVNDAAELAAAKPGHRLLGLFNDGNMTNEWTGARAELFPGSGPQTCIEHQRERGSKEPSLAEMTTKALELLTAGADAKTGFFLQVEGASIDKQDHAENPCGQIGETIAFDHAIKVGLEFARTHPDTLIVVTADHGHTSQIVGTVTPAEGFPRPGAMSTLLTKEGSPMTINYATRAHMQSQDHTGVQVHIAAQGPQAYRILGITNQTDLFHTFARALNLSKEGTK